MDILKVSENVPTPKISNSHDAFLKWEKRSGGCYHHLAKRCEPLVHINWLLEVLKRGEVMWRIPGTWHDSSTVMSDVHCFKNSASIEKKILPVTVKEFCQWLLKNPQQTLNVDSTLIYVKITSRRRSTWYPRWFNIDLSTLIRR